MADIPLDVEYTDMSQHHDKKQYMTLSGILGIWSNQHQQRHFHQHLAQFD